MLETEIRLKCDRCGEASDWFDGALYTRAMMLQELREIGWVRRRGGCLTNAGTECPSLTPGPHPLKRCPFCGSEALYFQVDYTQSVVVKCDGCDALGPRRNSEEDAAAWWNERGGFYESSTAT